MASVLTKVLLISLMVVSTFATVAEVTSYTSEDCKGSVVGTQQFTVNTDVCQTYPVGSTDRGMKFISCDDTNGLKYTLYMNTDCTGGQIGNVYTAQPGCDNSAGTVNGQERLSYKTVCDNTKGGSSSSSSFILPQLSLVVVAVLGFLLAF